MTYVGTDNYLPLRALYLMRSDGEELELSLVAQQQ